MTKHDSRTAWAQEQSAKRKAWEEMVELRKKNADLEQMLIKLVDDDCNEWYRLEILNLLNGVDNL